MRTGAWLARAVFTLFVVAFAGCGSVNGPEPAETLPLTRLTFPGIGGFQTEQRLVIRTQSAWEEIWNQLSSGRLLPPPRPTVDFTRDIVVVVGSGLKPSTGYEISIPSAAASGDEAVVQVRSTTPGNCVVAMMITSPVDVVRMPARERVVFGETTEPRNCS